MIMWLSYSNLLFLSAPPPDHHEVPQDKIDGYHQECRQHIAAIGAANFRPPADLPPHPALLHDLYEVLFQLHLVNGDLLPTAFVVEIWYSDHLRRPHSGLSRPVRLQGNFDQWWNEIVMTWGDWIDPFVALEGYVVRPTPDDVKLTYMPMLCSSSMPQSIFALLWLRSVIL